MPNKVSDVKKVALFCTSFWCDGLIRYENGMVGSFKCDYTWIERRKKRRGESELCPRCPKCGGANYNVKRNKDWREEYFACPSLALKDGDVVIANGAILRHLYDNLWSIIYDNKYGGYLSSAKAKKIIGGEIGILLRNSLASSINNLNT